jgi:hypothetical protein
VAKIWNRNINLLHSMLTLSRMSECSGLLIGMFGEGNTNGFLPAMGTYSGNISAQRRWYIYETHLGCQF